MFPRGHARHHDLDPDRLLLDAIRSPWAGDGLHIPAMVTLAAIAAAGFVLATKRLSRS